MFEEDRIEREILERVVEPYSDNPWFQAVGNSKLALDLDWGPQPDIPTETATYFLPPSKLGELRKRLAAASKATPPDDYYRRAYEAGRPELEALSTLAESVAKRSNASLAFQMLL